MYVYVVTRIIEGSKYGTPIPNLGIHTSKRRANQHFDSIVEDRAKFGKVHWDRETGQKFYRDERSVVLREALCTDGHCAEEFVRLEQWKVSNGRKAGSR